MGGQSLEKPLLGGVGFDYVKKTPYLVSSLKFILKSAMWIIFFAWSAVFFLNPTEFFKNLNLKFISSTEGTVYGITGSVFLLYSGPILVISILAILHLLISGEEDFRQKKIRKQPRFRLWTFPVLVDGPFGVVSATELIGIVIISVYIMWAVYAYTKQNLDILSKYKLAFTIESYLLLELTGLRLGLIGLFCLAFLFLPIARGSVLLRLIDIPVEHATKYHVWLGHLTMLLFTLHGLFYVIAWAMQGRLLKEILEWKHIGIANLPGLISLIAGLLMWVTSLGPVRRQNFELFFYTHQLYIVFIVFLVLHVGDFVFSIAAGGIFLFILDRFLRFCQSRRTVDVVSATSLPCGTVELVLSKPANLKYNALSFIFLQIRELSWLQWHPFSVSSSPLDGKYHISVLIKVLGEWTEKLRGSILSCPMGASQGEQPRPNITVSVEGPYGHESPYHLSYENLILVAGGIGISPFLAILSDILHRINDGEPCLPRNVLIVWAIKNSDELPLLQSLDIESICPCYSNMLNLEIQTYVTRESQPQLEKGKVTYPVSSFRPPARSRRGISVLVGTGDIMWSGIYVVASTIGLVFLVGLLQKFYINPFGITYWWYKGLLFLGCMIVSPIIFGGFVVGLWHLWGRKTAETEATNKDELKVDMLQNSEQRATKKFSQVFVCSSNTIQFGRRPNFREIFGSIGEKWGHVDVGVILCGPSALQSSVAKECRSQNLKRRCNDPIFHFNSHSFDL